MNMSLEDFKTEWLKEAHITEQVMNALTDESLKTAMTEHHRTLGQLAWHLVMSIQYMTMLGLQFEGPSASRKSPFGRRDSGQLPPDPACLSGFGAVAVERGGTSRYPRIRRRALDKCGIPAFYPGSSSASPRTDDGADETSRVADSRALRSDLRFLDRQGHGPARVEKIQST